MNKSWVKYEKIQNLTVQTSFMV